MLTLVFSVCSKSKIQVPEGALLKNGDVIVIVGNSITEQGDFPGGYVRLVREKLTSSCRGFDVRVINAGISGNKLKDIAARFQRDVLTRKPTWVVIAAGINDILHRLSSSMHEQFYLPQFAEQLERTVRKAQQYGIKVALCTTTIIGENPDSTGNRLLTLYNHEIRQVAKRSNCLLMDVNRAFRKRIATPGALALTRDGVHLNSGGNQLMAQVVLRGFGF